MTVLPLVAALPWIAVPILAAWRARGSPMLRDESGEPPAPAPLVSVIVPARNEARNIARCARSILASTYPALEVIVVDDHSTDDTGAIAHHIAADDPRLRVETTPQLPEGWFGKQWACATGAAAARGSILCFTDADTEHCPGLLVRAVNAMRARHSDLVTVAGRQIMESFWERVAQPQVFAMLLLRYGGARVVNRSHRVVDKIANGQFLLFARDAYDDVGGHEAVRGKVAEDLALAQLFYARGKRTELVVGFGWLATRMYASLGELVRGWMKNIYAAALDAAPMGRVGRALLPVMLLAFPVASLAPPLALLAAWAGAAPPAVGVWAAAATGLSLLTWGVVYAAIPSVSMRYALAYPLGAAVVAWIVVRAVARGTRVEWKGRTYHAPRP